MIGKRNYYYILMIFIAKSVGETCIPFLENQYGSTNDYLILPERVWRYNSATGVFEKLQHLKPNLTALCSIDFSNDLEGKVLSVAVDKLESYLQLEENSTNVSGFFGDVWTTLQDVLKFRSVYRRFENYSMLKTGEFDVLLSVSLMKWPTTAYYTHSTVIGTNSYSLFALSEGTFVSNWWYTRIFDVYVWVISTLFVIILTLIMVSIYNLRKSWCKQTESCDEFGFPTFNLLCVLGATSGQGFQEMPSSWSLRLCALTALNMGMLLSCGFNSTLTSYLAFRTPYVGMSDLDDVWKMGTHSLCVRNNSLAYNELSGAVATGTEPTATKDKWAKLLNRNCPDMQNVMELRSSLCHAGFVYVEASEIFLKEYRHVQDKCQIVKFPGTYWNSKISFLHRRGSKYRRTINTYLLRLRSTGILKYLEAKWSYKQEMQHGVFSNLQPVELGHIQLLIIGLIIMMILSVIICIFENIWFRFYGEGMNLNCSSAVEARTSYKPIHKQLSNKQSIVNF